MCAHPMTFYVLSRHPCVLQTKMAREKGADVIKYEVHTPDGYHLTMHRLAGGGGTPVLLMHGLLASSDQWFIMTPSYGKHQICFYCLYSC